MNRSRTLLFIDCVLALCLMPVLGLFIVGCSDDNPVNSFDNLERPAGTLVSVTPCKQFLTQGGTSPQPPNLDCIQYEYDGEDVLTLTHVNPGFNCCPGEITADIDVEDHVITLVEHESDHACRCRCLVDVNYRIEHVTPGVYDIKIVELYTESGDEPLEFTCDLTQTTSDVYCVERTHYPWDADLYSGASGRLVDMVGCKEPSATVDLDERETVDDCIEFEYLPGNILLLKHINAAFNCCPVVETDVAVASGVITIAERELDGQCDCYCLFDLYYMVVNLPAGEYTISVDEHYDEELEFSIDLRETSSGTYCVERNHSPR